MKNAKNSIFRLTAAALSPENLREVEQKDIQVRLQEIFRDRKVSLDQTVKNMESHFENLTKVSYALLWEEILTVILH